LWVGGTYFVLPQFEQAEALRLVLCDFLVALVLLQFLQFDCFISLPPTIMLRKPPAAIPASLYSQFVPMRLAAHKVAFPRA